MSLKQYRGVAKTLREYWSIYGGLRALIGSPYLHVSVIVSMLVYSAWKPDPGELFDLIFTIVPSILGFSLGGYAILLAFGDDHFRQIISGPDKDGRASPFMEVNAAFIHFIVVSTLTLILGVVGSAIDVSGCVVFVACVLLIYSIACALASAFAIFTVAGCFDTFNASKK